MVSFFPLKTTDNINKYISKNTQGKVTNAIREVSRNDKLIVANVTSFHGTWKYKFVNTTKSQFLDGSCDMMTSPTQVWKYHETDMFQAVCLPFQNGFDSVVILPKDGVKLFALLSKSSKDFFFSVLNNLKPLEGTVQLPKFHINDCRNLMNHAYDLGIKNIYSSRDAEIPVVKFPNVFVSHTIHATQMHVDETGGAEKSIEISSDEEKKFSMTMNKEFLFTVHKNNDMAFVAAVRDVTK